MSYVQHVGNHFAWPGQAAMSSKVCGRRQVEEAMRYLQGGMSWEEVPGMAVDSRFVFIFQMLVVPLNNLF